MKEIKHIMKLALLGLHEVLEKGYVYCGLSIKIQIKTVILIIDSTSRLQNGERSSQWI